MARKIAIVRPLPFTITGSSGLTNPNNLLTPDPKEAATIANGVTATVDIDLGSAQSVDSFFAGYIGPGMGTVSIQYGTSGPTDTLLTNSLIHQGSVLATPTYHRPFVNTSAVTARYARFTFPATFAATFVGALAVGLSVPITWGHEFGSGRPIEDTGTAERLFSGGFGIYEGVRVGGYQWSFGDLYDTEVEALYALQRDRGSTRSLLVIEDPTQSSGLNERTHWGLLDKIETYERQLPGASRYSLKIRDWA